ncbi:hypothetical protein BLNAU_21427 [Blattamonas nauphoetae]|uniref:Uncharacterized protein n=1 Tax=Blattamonas nauphoetae TaxID=2049346 RepID=A0ABQ9WVW7_9EUKA|nr:hypothetical protein BLNAU_21427 [Blattamonas nauphoetae]
MTDFDTQQSSSTDSPCPDCSAILDWYEEKLESEHEIVVVYQSLVATVQFQPMSDVALEAKAVQFLESVFGRTTDESSTNFLQSILVLLSSTSRTITIAAMNLLRSLFIRNSHKVKLALVKADLLPRLINILHPLSLSFVDAIDIRTGLLTFIDMSVWLATPHYLTQQGIEDRNEQQDVLETKQTGSCERFGRFLTYFEQITLFVCGLCRLWHHLIVLDPCSVATHSPLRLPHHPHPPTPLCLSLTTHTLPLPLPLPHHPHPPTPLCLSLTTHTLPLPLPLPHHPHPPSPLCLSLTTHTLPLPLPLPHHPHPPTPSASPSPPTPPTPSASPSPPTPSHSLCLSLTIHTLPLPLPLPHHPHPPSPLCLSLTTHTLPSPLCLSLTTHTLPLPSASPSPPTPSHSLCLSLTTHTLPLPLCVSLTTHTLPLPLRLPHHPHPPTPLCLSLTTHTLPLPLPLPHHPHPPTPSASPSPSTPSHSLCLSLTTHTLPLPSASPSPPTPSHSLCLSLTTYTSHSSLPLPHHPHPPTPSASPSPPTPSLSPLPLPHNPPRATDEK